MCQTLANFNYPMSHTFEYSYLQINKMQLMTSKNIQVYYRHTINFISVGIINLGPHDSPGDQRIMANNQGFIKNAKTITNASV